MKIIDTRVIILKMIYESFEITMFEEHRANDMSTRNVCYRTD